MYVSIHAVLMLKTKSVESSCIDTYNHVSTHEAKREGMYRYKTYMYRLILKKIRKTGFGITYKSTHTMYVSIQVSYASIHRILYRLIQYRNRNITLRKLFWSY